MEREREPRWVREILGGGRRLALAEMADGALDVTAVACEGVGGCAVACKGDRRLKLELEEFLNSSAGVSVSSLQRLEAVARKAEVGVRFGCGERGKSGVTAASRAEN